MGLESRYRCSFISRLPSLTRVFVTICLAQVIFVCLLVVEMPFLMCFVYLVHAVSSTFPLEHCRVILSLVLLYLQSLNTIADHRSQFVCRT